MYEIYIYTVSIKKRIAQEMVRLLSKDILKNRRNRLRILLPP